MPDRLQQQLEAFERALEGVRDEDSLYALQVAYIGRKGSISLLRRDMGKMSPDQRKQFGVEFNRVKRAIEAGIETRRQFLSDDARRRELERFEDLTMPPRRPEFGSLHPLTRTRRALASTFRRMGFDVEDGPHVEHGRYNFDFLNFLPDHPARDEQDTFFVEPRGDTSSRELVLRTHTSPIQVRTMLARTPPVRIIALGTVFRRDEDRTHSPMFHQIEGLYVDRGVTMADLKATLLQFTGSFFGPGLDVRLRPSFFPFVEPGAEFDMQCPFCRGARCVVCKQTGWIELGGSGMVHPNVLRDCGIDPAVYTGWAFGFGLDRMTMLLHDVPKLRYLFEGDIRFLEQFPC
ncbi:MAG: phenylalanine--tRNA ligase subunit alpha [Myxococcales bacterium]|nr:phenylalanine--tRNA ligase subunit alpha [Myxococcales bacterium]MCB9754417.1 phenylalanine--tRNA ligase subunit alpha [Myxococcales bacterium]